VAPDQPGKGRFGIPWPPVVAEVIGSRLAVLLIAVLGGSCAMFLHPELGEGLLPGTREFRKATEGVAREIRDGDNDMIGSRRRKSLRLRFAAKTTLVFTQPLTPALLPGVWP
jgi:hypothetical protein